MKVKFLHVKLHKKTGVLHFFQNFVLHRPGAEDKNNPNGMITTPASLTSGCKKPFRNSTKQKIQCVCHGKWTTEKVFAFPNILSLDFLLYYSYYWCKTVILYCFNLLSLTRRSILSSYNSYKVLRFCLFSADKVQRGHPLIINALLSPDATPMDVTSRVRNDNLLSVQVQGGESDH